MPDPMMVETRVDLYSPRLLKDVWHRGIRGEGRVWYKQVGVVGSSQMRQKTGHGDQVLKSS